MDESCQQFFVKNGYILENGYYELLSDNIEKAKNLFNAIKDNNIRAHWASFMISLIEENVKEYPSYFELRNFLEIDLNILLTYSGQWRVWNLFMDISRSFRSQNSRIVNRFILHLL